MQQIKIPDILNRTKTVLSVFVLLALAVLLTNAQAEDWPTYNHDRQRSCISSENLKMPLHLQWQYEAKNAPRPAWPAPAKTDYWHREANLKPRVIYDRTYHLVSVGDNIYFGSSADDKIYCLDARSGKEKWSFFTGGPVRLAPTISGGLLYAGSDDGSVYCLNAENGKLVWKIDAEPEKRLLPGNERVISVCPVRTGVIVDNGIAYFCSGLFPNEGVEMYAVKAKDGEIIWKKSADLSPQGYMLASAEKLYIPTGRTTPQVFSRKEGKRVGAFGGNGGTYALLDGGELIYGGGDEGELNDLSVKTNDQVATYDGLQMIVAGNISYLRSDGELSAINRGKYFKSYKKWEKASEKKSDLADDLWDLREKRKLASADDIKKIDKKIAAMIEKIANMDQKREKIESGGIVWKEKIDTSYSMILSGNTIFLGGRNKIDAIDAANGKVLWSKKVAGDVYGLAVANGRLLASTDEGNIYAFAARSVLRPAKRRSKIVKNPYPKKLKNIYRTALKQILDTGITRGYCLVIGSEDGRLAYELAKRTNLKIVGIESDPVKVEKSRRLLDKAGLYGTRVGIQLGSLEKLPYSKYFADLIVSDKMLLTGELPTSANEVYRVLKPFGGVACLGVPNSKSEFISQWVARSDNADWQKENNAWVVVKRGAIKGAGEWTHLYANPSNTACSNDPVQAPLQMQWFGRPGPRQIINRHSRPMSTLFKDGRLFIPANNRVIAVDAYNGTPLWNEPVPNSRILGALKDCGNMAVADDYVYVAADEKCRALKVDNGKQAFALQAPQLIPGEERDWGYLALVDDQVFGSGKKKGASFTILGKFNCDQFEGDFREMVMSDYLFSLNRKTGDKLWTYKNGVVFNNTITIGDGAVYFIESRNKRAVNDPDGRIRVDYFCQGPTFLIKLDQRSGKKIWEKAVRFPFQQIMYLSYSQDVVLATGSYNKGRYVHYGLFAFDGGSGKEIWHNSYRGGDNRWNTSVKKSTIDGSHGEQWQHPVIIADKIYLPPHDFDLHTGKEGGLNLTRGGHGCGGLSGSASNLFARGSNPRIYDIFDGNQSGKPLTRVSRPGCWINIIPAGNLISIPEASSGCTCDYPVQTSFVFVSKN